jgi:putative ABC transport system permease protein
MRRLWRLFHKHQAEKRLDAELRFHVERRVAEYIAAGMNAEDAGKRARHELGGIEQMKQECREARKMHIVEDLVQDVRHGSRLLRKNPGFTAIVILTLALGIGANTLIFSVAYNVLLRPLPYPSPEKLVTLWESNPQQNTNQGQVSAANYYDWESDNSVFASTAAYSAWRFNLTGVAEPENVSGALVTPRFFSVLGVQAPEGRTFRSDEDQSGKEEVVVSQSLWNRVFGSAARLSGQTLTLNRSVFTVVGIMPPDFAYPSRKTELWVPLSLSAENKQNRNGRWLTVVARMKSGVTSQDVTADLNVIAARLRTGYPKANANVDIRVVGLHDYLVGETRTTVVVLLGAVGLLLILACANVASLIFARGSGRAGEFAVRYAIGAPRGRIIRQLLAESALLVAIGAVVGILLAFWGAQSVRFLGIESIPRIQNVAINVPVIEFTLCVSLFVTAIVGLLPAFRASSSESLKEGTNRLASNPAIQRRRAVLVGAQIGLAFVLLVGAGLLTGSFLRLTRVNPGFQLDNRLSFNLSLPRSKYATNVQQNAFFVQMLDKINQQSGVLDSGGVSDLPLLGNRMGFKLILERADTSGAQTTPEAGARWATPGYFHAIGMLLRKGRLFSSQDGADTLPVAVINQSTADRFWAGHEAIGRRIRLEEDPRWFTVVGIVDDIKQGALDSEEGPTVYFPYAQKSEVWLNWMAVVIHSSLPPRGLVTSMREQVRSLDKDQPITDVATLEEHLADLEALPKLRMTVMGSFSLLAFCLSMIGVFGMISYSVAQRSHEIGIRMALGAQAGDILRQFLGQGIRCVLWGLMTGICGALLLTRLLKSLLFGVDPVDITTFALVTAVLFAVALAACWLPARRATRIDPIVALRYE